MKVLLNLCLLFSLISPALLLTCERCSSRKGTKCGYKTNETCISKHYCRSMIFDSNVFLKTKQVKKSCYPKVLCDPGYYSLTTSGGGFLKMLVDCCTTDNCNSKPLEFPTEPMKPNGLECLGCQSEVKGQEECEGTEMVKCLGDETKCISMRIDYMKLNVSIIKLTLTTKGCATPQMCNEHILERNIRPDFVYKRIMAVNCTDPIESHKLSRLA